MTKVQKNELPEIIEHLTAKVGVTTEDEIAHREWEKMAKAANPSELKVVCINYHVIVGKIKSNHLKIAG
jgi:hypothetical protein